MTFESYKDSGPPTFHIDTAASTSELHADYLVAGTQAIALDTGRVQVYDGSAWVDPITVLETAVNADIQRAAYLDADFDADSGTTGDTPTATDLAVSVSANTVYTVDAVLFATATTNGGIELSFTGPASATAVLQASIFQDTAVTVNDGEMDISGAVNYIAAALSFDRIILSGVLTVDATAGTFTILAAQDTEHADNTLIHAGSYLRLMPIS